LKNFESKDFAELVEMTDFLLRGHKVILVLRRRRWLDVRTNKNFTLPPPENYGRWHCYSKDFAVFYKRRMEESP